MRYSFFLLIFVCSFFTSFGQAPVHLDDRYPYRNIGKSLSFLEDPSGTLSFGEIKALHNAGKFIPSDKEILNFGNSQSAFWLKLDYLNRTDGSAFLVIDVPNIEAIDVYEEQAGGKRFHLRSGSLFGKSKGVIASNNFVFHLPEIPVQAALQSVYIRVHTNNILLLPIKLATSESIIANGSVKTRFESMYIGALVVLFLFNLFLYLSFKDHLYFIYSIYVGTVFIYMVFYLRGYGYVFGQDFRAFINLYPHVFLSISCLAAAVFSINFLDIHKRLPKVIVVFKVLIASWLLIFFLSAFGYKSLIAAGVNYLLMVSSLFLWALGFWTYLKGHKPALYYILAWAFVCIPIFYITLTISGIIPFQEYTFLVIPAGTTIELLLLSFALGDRFNTIRRQNIRLITTQKERLEKLVQGRTLKLRESVKMLEESNAVKNKLFSIIAHDLRSPFNSLLSIFSLKDMNLLTFEDLQMLLNESRKSIDTIHNTLNNLLYWAKSQMEGAVAFPSVFDLKAMVNDLILVYQPLTERKSIGILVASDEDLQVYADENQIQLIMRNLIDNAIKFTPFEENIGIILKRDGEHVVISVSNPVSDPVNISSFDMDKIQEPAYGTANEKGVGLGLHLCREYVAQNGGELLIKFKSNEVIFSFQLIGIDHNRMVPSLV
jgi:signal transduction histidine kinase